LNSGTDLIILIGPPGAGKGSVSELCTRHLGWMQLSTGNLCRKHIAAQTEIGKQIDFAIKSGKLVSDSLVTEMVEGWLNNQIGNVPAVILDGFPRTIAQAQALDEFLKIKMQSSKIYVIRLRISDENIVLRLGDRYICSNSECQAVYSLSKGSKLIPQKSMVCDVCGHALSRRKDDEENAIRERLHIYNKHEQDLLNFYKNAKNTQYLVSELNVERALPEIFEDLKKLVGVGLDK